MIISKPTQQFVKDDASAHYYQLHNDGSVTAMHDVVRADGSGRRPTTLSDARKLKLFPSPTSIEKDVRANPMLARWLKNELAKAFVNNPRLPAEADMAYAERVLKIADGTRDFAATRGTAIHAAIENSGTIDQDILPFYEAYLPWQDANVDFGIAAEMKMADPRIGVAGTVDRVIMHKQHGLCILDYKTQKMRDGNASFYESFPRQLSFYAQAYQHKHGGPLPRIMSVVIDSRTPSLPQDKLYTLEEQGRAYTEFLLQVWLWCNHKEYWPVGYWYPSFPF